MGGGARINPLWEYESHEMKEYFQGAQCSWNNLYIDEYFENSF